MLWLYVCIQIQKRHSSSSMDERPSPSPSARDYVESLHQNSRATLLFGKNNVLVQPVNINNCIMWHYSFHKGIVDLNLIFIRKQPSNHQKSNVTQYTGICTNDCISIMIILRCTVSAHALTVYARFSVSCNHVTGSSLKYRGPWPENVKWYI